MFIRNISFDKQFQELYLEIVKEKIMNQTNKDVLGPKHYESLNSIQGKLIKLQDLYIDGEMSKSDYEIAKERYENLRDELKSKEVSILENKKVFDAYKTITEKFISIDQQYDSANLEFKRGIIGSIFQKEIHLENKKVRTAKLNPILLEIASVNRGLRGEKEIGLN
jgi:site-specific DNA recombinase